MRVPLVSNPLHRRKPSTVSRWRVICRAIRQCVPPLVLFAGFLSLYSLTLTRWHHYDAVSYALQIRGFEETGKAGWLFHPHHLLFNGLGLLSHRALAAIHTQVDPLRSLQFMNAFLGSLGAVLIYAVLTRGGLRVRRAQSAPHFVDANLAFAAALVVGTSYGYWVCATDGRVNTPGVCALTLALGLAWGMLDCPCAVQAVAMALATALALVLHQSHGLFVVSGAVAIWLAPVPSLVRTRLAALYLFGFGSAVVLLYLGVALWVKGFTTFDQLGRWALAYAVDGRWWSFEFPENLARAGMAVAYAFVTGLPGTREGPVWPGMAYCVRLLQGSLGLALGLWLWDALRLLFRRTRAAGTRARAVEGRLVVLASLVASYGLFFSVWCPGNYVFWIPVALALVAWLAVRASDALLWSRRVAVVMIVWTLLAIATSLTSTIARRTNAEHNPALSLCRALNRHMRAQDILLVSGTAKATRVGHGLLCQFDPPIDIYARYFTRRRVVSLDSCFASMRAEPGRATQYVRSLVQSHTRVGGTVVVLDDVLDEYAWRELNKRYGVSPALREAILRGYRMKPMFTTRETTAYRLSRGP